MSGRSFPQTVFRELSLSRQMTAHAPAPPGCVRPVTQPTSLMGLGLARRYLAAGCSLSRYQGASHFLAAYSFIVSQHGSTRLVMSTMKTGSVVALVDPSGSGQSTLLRVIAGRKVTKKRREAHAPVPVAQHGVAGAHKAGAHIRDGGPRPGAGLCKVVPPLQNTGGNCRQLPPHHCFRAVHLSASFSAMERAVAPMVRWFAQPMQGRRLTGCGSTAKRQSPPPWKPRPWSYTRMTRVFVEGKSWSSGAELRVAYRPESLNLCTCMHMWQPHLDDAGLRGGEVLVLQRRCARCIAQEQLAAGLEADGSRVARLRRRASLIS